MAAATAAPELESDEPRNYIHNVGTACFDTEGDRSRDTDSLVSNCLMHHTAALDCV